MKRRATNPAPYTRPVRLTERGPANMNGSAMTPMDETSGRRLRVGVVGLGTHGTRYARHAALDIDGMELVAVCRRDETAGRAVADELGCDFTTDALELIGRDDIDAVVLTTVPDLLPGFIEASVDAGKRLLVEKPVARSLGEGRRIAALIDESETYCLAGHTLRFNTVCRTIRALIDTIGPIDSMTFSQGFPPQPERAWLDEPERSGGGNILHTGVHGFDLLRYFTGLEPATVCATTRSVVTRDTEDRFAAAITFHDSDALATVACSRTTAARNGLIEIVGEREHLVGDHVHNTLYRVTADGREDIALAQPAPTVREILHRLAEDARTGSAAPVTYRDGLAAVAVADACYRSAASEKFEAVHSFR